MPEYKTLKIPLKIWEIFDKYIKSHDTVYIEATGMIHDLIRDKAKELLEEMSKTLEVEKGRDELILKRLEDLEKNTKK